MVSDETVPDSEFESIKMISRCLAAVFEIRSSESRTKLPESRGTSNGKPGLIRCTLQETRVTDPANPSSNELAAQRTELAAKRTLMAADRSLMAWIRTALSMISFGFTIYKVLEGFEEAGVHMNHPETPRRVGLFLTGLGTVSMVMGTIEYWRTLVELRENHDFSVWRPTFFIALIMAVSGSFVFVSIIIRLL